MVSPPSVRFNILTVFNNPYLRTISKWNSIATDSREIIKKEYPEIEKLSEAYEKKKKDWEEYVKEGLERTNNILEGFNNRINTVSEVIEKVSTGIEWGLAVYTIGSTIICPPAGGAVALATGGTVLTRKAVAKVLPKLGGIICTEIAKDLGQEHKELQNKLNTFFKKHNSNNSNNRNNNRGSNNNNITRVGRKYKGGEFWNNKLFDSKDGAKNAGVPGKKIDKILGELKIDKILGELKAVKRKIGGEVRADKNGNFYTFDDGHKTAKIHLEKIEKRADGYYNTAEVDPETGTILKGLKRFVCK